MSAEQFQELMQGMQQAFRSQIGDTRFNTLVSTTSTHAGMGYADTAAQQSVASHSLYEVLPSAGQVFEKTTLVATLADGKPRTGEVLLTTADVTLQGRTVRTTFIVLPEARNNKTLLGIDFLTDAGVNLNVADRTWCFVDDPQSVYQLHTEPTPGSGGACLDYMQSLRPEGCEAFESDQRRRLDSVIQANEEVFAQGGEPTPYAEHIVDIGDHPPVSVPPYRPPARKKEILRDEVEKMLADPVIEGCEPPWTAPVVLVPKKDVSTRVCIDCRRLMVAASTTEAEIVAANEAAKEVIWLSRLFGEIVKLKHVPVLQVDNAAAVRLAQNPEFHRRTKHIAMKHFFVREKVNK